MELSGSDILDWITFGGDPIISCLFTYTRRSVYEKNLSPYSAQYDTYNN